MALTKNIHQIINVRSNIVNCRVKDKRKPSNRLVQCPHNRDFDYWKTSPFVHVNNGRNYLREDIN